MKKRKVNKWVEVLLQLIAITSFVCLASDCDNLNQFIVVHIIALNFFTLSNYILYKYTDLFER